MPSGKSLPGITLVALLAVALTAAGLVAFWPTADQQSSPDPIGHNASDRLAELDGYVATVESSYTFGNESNESVQRLWARPSTGERRAEIITGPSDSLVVSNGSVTWLYNRDQNNVTRVNYPTLLPRRIRASVLEGGALMWTPGNQSPAIGR